MPNRVLAPTSIAPPAANYAHGVLSQPTAMVHTSGVVPIGAGGFVPEDLGEQAALVWRNIGAILADAGMIMADIVSVTTYVVVDHLSQLGTVMGARDAALGGTLVASTLVTVPALARPEWKMEVSVVAAR